MAAIASGVLPARGGVEKDDVGAQALGGRAAHPGCRVGAEKLRVGHPVGRGVRLGCPHGGRRLLNPDEPPSLPGRAKPDRADAAVGVKDCLAAGQPGRSNRGAVEPLGLVVVDLVKAARRDGEPQAAELVLDAAGAEQHPHVPPKHRAGAARVVVVDEGGQPGGFAAQRRHKLPAAGQPVAGRDKDRHHLPRAHPDPHQNVAQKPRAAVLVIGGPDSRALRSKQPASGNGSTRWVPAA